MNFDKVLSRFKIQTKVFLFVLPFVLSMTAVGLIGLYASDLLVSRMEISNSVLTSLRGFKDVYASMNRFLANVSDATYVEAKRRASEQLNALQTAAVNLRSEKGVEQLHQAVGEAEGIAANIESVWRLHKAEVKSLSDIEITLGEMEVMQDEMRRHIKAFGDAARRKVNRNKVDLVRFSSLELAADTLNRISVESSNGVDPATAFDKFKSHAKEFEKTAKFVNTLLPKDHELAQALQTVLHASLDIISGSDTSSVDVAGELTKLRNIAALLKHYSSDSLVDAIGQFKVNDAEVGRVDAVAERMGAVGLNHASIRLLASSLAYKPSSARMEAVRQSLYMYRIAVARVANDAKSDPYFASLDGRTGASTEKLMKIGAALVKNDAEQRDTLSEAAERIDRTWNMLSDFAALQREYAGRERSVANRISIGATLLGIAIAVFAGIGMVFTFKGPIGQITSTMRRLASGVLDIGISGQGRSDEIGDMARALSVFKDNAIAKVSIEEEAERSRQASETERRRNEQERLENNLQVEFAINSLALALSELAQGHLCAEIDTPFADNLDKLRHDFNTSVAGLRNTLLQVLESSALIQDSGRDMHVAADDLSRRTEQQAAALEQTAASVEEITTTVRVSTERTFLVLEIVRKAKQKADNSARIVQDAISAITRIRKASHSIAEIVGVIDSIAFQTNLLALNAGVEAARAGETGKGFAVVAHEVRELAQRSANAAKEIGGLIANATEEVASGAIAVEETGNALIEISTQIVDISSHVDHIATSARNQSVSLEEVNASINAMDQVTQRNAAMVEETNAASRRLAEKADLLMGLIGRFELNGERGRSSDDEAA